MNNKKIIVAGGTGNLGGRNQVITEEKRGTSSFVLSSNRKQKLL